MPSTYKKDKPWDTDDIDKWNEEPFKPEHNLGGTLSEESSFATLFHKYSMYNSNAYILPIY